MGELFPIASGLIVGGVLGLVRPTMRIWVGAILAIVVGVLATIVSGEYAISWAFLLVDIPLVAISAAAGLALIRRVRMGHWDLRS